MTEDFTQFFADYGVECTFGASSFAGIFDANYQSADIGMVSIESRIATLQCAAGDVSGITEGSVVTVDGNSYTVKDVEPDGTGMVTLTLLK